MANNAALILLIQADIDALNGTQTSEELTTLKVGAVKLGMDTTAIQTRLDAIDMSSASAEEVVTNAVANNLGGGGSVELGQLVQTSADTLGGKSLLPCDGTVIDTITYPDMLTVLNSSQYIESGQAAASADGFLSNGSHSMRPGQYVCADDGSKMIAFAGISSAVGVSDVTHFTGLYGTVKSSGMSTDSTNTTIEWDNFNNVNVAISDDGNAAIAVGVDSTRTKIFGWYWGSTSMVFDDSMDTAITLFATGECFPAITGDGSYASVVLYDTGNSPNLRVVVDSSPAGLNSFTNGSDTGLPDSKTAVGHGADFDGSNHYILLADFTLYKNTTLSAGGAWSQVNAATPNLSAQVYNSRFDVTGDGTGLMYSRLDSPKGGFHTSDRWWISSDSGVTCTEIVKEVVAADKYGNAYTYTVMSALQKRSGAIGYIVKRTPINKSPIHGTLETTYEFVVDVVRSPTWLADTYAGTAGSHTADNWDSALGLGHIIDFDEAAPEQIIVWSNNNSVSPYRVNILPNAAVTPLILNTKIVAEA